LSFPRSTGGSVLGAAAAGRSRLIPRGRGPTPSTWLLHPLLADQRHGAKFGRPASGAARTWQSSSPVASVLLDLLGWHFRHAQRHRQFPAACDASPSTKPPVNVNRICRTAIEHRRHPVAHTRRTMGDQYLKRSRTVQADSRTGRPRAGREPGRRRSRGAPRPLTYRQPAVTSNLSDNGIDAAARFADSSH
jgi:hypothetical protein